LLGKGDRPVYSERDGRRHGGEPRRRAA
jgi:hypothetical protein